MGEEREEVWVGERGKGSDCKIPGSTEHPPYLVPAGAWGGKDKQRDPLPPPAGI